MPGNMDRRVPDRAALEKTPGSLAGTAPTNGKHVAVNKPGRSAFTPLFNGKDTTGWKKLLPDNGSDWGSNR